MRRSRSARSRLVQGRHHLWRRALRAARRRAEQLPHGPEHAARPCRDSAENVLRMKGEIDPRAGREGLRGRAARARRRAACSVTTSSSSAWAPMVHGHAVSRHAGSRGARAARDRELRAEGGHVAHHVQRNSAPRRGAACVLPREQRRQGRRARRGLQRHVELPLRGRESGGRQLTWLLGA